MNVMFLFYCNNAYMSLQIHGFATSALVCDGASTNMAVIKSTHGCSGAYGFNPQHADPYAVEPWFTNSFNLPLKIFWLICPSHQVICTCTY